MRKLFTKELTKRWRRATKIIWWRCNKEAVMQLIEDHRNRLTQFVVSCEGSAQHHFLALYVGRIGPKKISLFYEKGNFYRSLEKSRASQDEEPLVEPCSFEEAWVSPILKFLDDKTFLQSNEPRLVAHKGFFIFQCMAQWGAGGYDEGPVERPDVIPAENFDAALDLLQGRLAAIRENHFWAFSVYFDGYWHKIQTEPVVIPGFTNSVFKLEEVRT